MKTFALILLFFSISTNAQSEKGKCPNFFDGINKAPYSKSDLIEMMKRDEGKREYLKTMKAEIADVQDTGERFKCHCYHYLIKYKSIEDGKVWIEPVEIRDGAVYVPTAKSVASPATSAR